MYSEIWFKVLKFTDPMKSKKTILFLILLVLVLVSIMVRRVWGDGNFFDLHSNKNFINADKFPAIPKINDQEIAFDDFPYKYKSLFFKNQFPPRPHLPIDLGNENIIDDNGLDTQTTGYKLYVALHMLGYSYSNISDKQLHLNLLKKFQTSNGYAVSNELSQEVFDAIDSQLADREKLFDGSSSKFSPLFENLKPEIAENLFPADYIAWIFTMPLEAIPSNLQMHNLSEYADCINPQCVGTLTDLAGNELDIIAIGKVTPATQFYFKPDIYYSPQNIFQVSSPASTQIQVILHEYAHYIDSNANISRYPTMNFPRGGSIDTTNFYNISYDFDWSDKNKIIKGDYNENCFRQKSGLLTDFISYYSFDSNPNSDKGCPAGSSEPWEEFADSFAFYITAGTKFRHAAQKNPVIKLKYEWLKNNLFKGTEYYTDLTNMTANYVGCSDSLVQTPGPSYISCDENYIWKGTLPSNKAKIKKLAVPKLKKMNPPPIPPRPFIQRSDETMLYRK